MNNFRDPDVGGDQTITDLNNVFGQTGKEGPDEMDIMSPVKNTSAMNDVNNYFKNKGDRFMDTTKLGPGSPYPIGRMDTVKPPDSVLRSKKDQDNVDGWFNNQGDSFMAPTKFYGKG
jgi:hypothetical protein